MIDLANDALRASGKGGRVLLTAGVNALGLPFSTHMLAAVRAFSDFTPDNDPYHEHDFGAVVIEGQRLFWKIDYYDAAMQYGSEDPTDPTVTTRVLTVMLAEEY